MDKWLQSRKSVLIFTLLIALIGFFAMFEKTGTVLYQSDKEDDKSIATNILIQKISREDSDGDGLKDWEENLWKTDPFKKDTDGDGTDDNDEILQNRDPLKPRPEDFISNNINNFDKTNGDSDLDLTETDIVAMELLSGYLTLKQNGSLTDENQERLIGAIAEKRFSAGTTNQYSKIDINIIDKNNIEVLKLYSEEVTNILNKYADTESDLVIIKRALDSGDFKEAEKLNESMFIYKDMEKELSGVVVPKDLASIHLKILNTVSQIAENTGNMARVFEDPVLALVSLNQYVENEKIIVDEFAKIGVYLKNKGVNVSS